MFEKIKNTAINYISAHKLRVALSVLLGVALLVFIGMHIGTYTVFDMHIEAYDLNLTLLLLTLIVAFLAFLSALVPLKTFLGDTARAIIGDFFFLALPFALVYVCEMMYETTMFYMGMYKMYLVNVAIYFMIFFAARAIFMRRSGAAAILASAICYIFTFVCICVLHFRGTPFMPIDIIAVKTAVAVADRYVLVLSADMVFGIVVAVFVVLFSLNFMDRSPKNLKAWKGAVARICLLAMSVGIGVWFWVTSPIQAQGYEFRMLNQSHYYNYWTFGTSAAFFENIKHSLLTTPENYSASEIKSWQAQYGGTNGSSERPNIIVVMNESFCDYSMWGNDFGLVGADTGAPFFESLYESSPHGKLLVSTTGGGTCNSEFEALTGNSMYNLPVSSFPYLQYVRSGIGSAVKYAEDLGYKTIGTHPALGSNWNRSEIYKMLGFDETAFIGSYDENAETRRDFVTDGETYKKVLQLIKQTEEPLFVFDITIQNHSSYLEGAEEVVVGIRDKESFPLANNFVNLIYLSDRDLEQFIAELKKLDEPTVLLFFGDHQAGVIESGFEDMVFGFDSANPTSIAEAQEQYVVHWLMWSNFENWNADDYNIVSANYLMPILFCQMGLPLSGFQQYMLDMMQTLPAINACGVITADGRYYSREEDMPADIAALLDRYAKVQYYSMFDRAETDEFYKAP